eukprot:GCRY01003161.1.p1 GENE.GCRY01003161.1~~GCRY01003161.1.p1  ORF type:complete len:220 (+),score=33.59 GCRY01003161.1:260-919(+)
MVDDTKKCVETIEEFWLCVLAKRKLEKLKHDFSERNDVIKEILMTEKSYVDSLKVLIDVYYTPLKNEYAKNGPTALISAENLFKIFSNIEMIYAVSVLFLEKLNAAIENSDKYSPRIGKVFVSYASLMKSTAYYCTKYDNGVDILRRLINSLPCVATFFQRAQANPRCNKHNVFSFLIRPVQRVPRYLLLLEVFPHYVFRLMPCSFLFSIFGHILREEK